MGPIYEAATSLEGDHLWTLRPIATYSEQGENYDLSLLWPFVRAVQKPRMFRFRLSPIYDYTAYTRGDGTVDRDHFFLPLVFWGTDLKPGQERQSSFYLKPWKWIWGSSPSDDYAFHTPFGGTIRSLLAHEEITTLHFPLYMRLRDRIGTEHERRSFHLIWPLWNHVSGELEEGWRLLPLYGSYRQRNDRGELRSTRRFVLWPLYIHEARNLDSKRPVQTTWIFPFYAHSRSPTVDSYTALWPFFRYARNLEEPGGSYTLLLYTHAWGAGERQWDFMPIYGYRETPNYTRQYLLWPIQRYERVDADTAVAESFWFLPFVTHYRHADHVRGVEWSRTRVWPFMLRRTEESGEVLLAIPELLPFDGPEAFDRTYARIWQLYRRVDLGQGRGSRWDLLWGLFRGESLPESSSLSLLGGLFQRDREGDEVRWRIFFIRF